MTFRLGRRAGKRRCEIGRIRNRRRRFAHSLATRNVRLEEFAYKQQLFSGPAPPILSALACRVACFEPTFARWSSVGQTNYAFSVVSFCRHPSDEFAKNTSATAGRQARRGNGRSPAICVFREIRSQATEFHYPRDIQPQPKIGPWRERLDSLLLENDGKPARERLTLIRVFEELHVPCYEGG